MRATPGAASRRRRPPGGRHGRAEGPGSSARDSRRRLRPSAAGDSGNSRCTARACRSGRGARVARPPALLRPTRSPARRAPVLRRRPSGSGPARVLPARTRHSVTGSPLTCPSLPRHWRRASGLAGPRAAGPHAAPRPGELRPRMLGPAASCFESARRKGADRRPQNQPTIVPPGCTHAPGVAWPMGCSGPLSWSRTAPRDRAQGMLRPSEQDSWAAVCCPRKRILQGSES